MNSSWNDSNDNVLWHNSNKNASSNNRYNEIGNNANRNLSSNNFSYIDKELLRYTLQNVKKEIKRCQLYCIL